MQVLQHCEQEFLAEAGERLAESRSPARPEAGSSSTSGSSEPIPAITSSSKRLEVKWRPTMGPH
eukprot:9094471-Pyramimonas_sp.AAC.1